METATGSNGSTKRARRRDAPTPEDLRAKVRLRKKEQMGLGWGRVTRFIFRLMMRHPFMVGGVLFMTLFLAAFEIAHAMLLAPFLNMLMGGEAGALAGTPIGVLIPLFEGMPVATQLQWYAGIYFGLTFFKAGFLYGLTRLAQFLHIAINRDLRLMLFEDILAVEMRWVNKQRSSNLFTLVHSFPSSASKIVDQYMMGFQNFTSFVAIVITLALVSVPLLLMAAAIGLVVTAVALQLTRVVRRLAYDVKESRLSLYNVTLESLSALKVLHLFGRTGHTRERYNTELKDFQRHQFKQAAVKALVTPVQSVLSAAFIAGLLFGATIMYDLTTGAYLATIALFMVVVTKFQSRSSKYAKRRAEIAAEIPAMEEVIDHFEDKEKRYVQDGRRPFKGLQEGIRFDQVRFGYEASEPEVIKGVSFDVPKGHMVAIVGGSGAGKSTLIDLLARIYDPDAGAILVDGHDLRELRLAHWRGRVAVVSQDSFLFNTSVRENIRFGRLDATDDEIEAAARQANAMSFIDALPQGFETTLGDRGVRLSGGQRQRIAIARAILADPDILILDEATSALDTETEAQVQAAIDEVAKDRTIIAIAHRLSTVRKADQIVVLEHGEIVERGQHDELLAQRGRYWEYVQLQDLGRSETVEAAVGALPPDERLGWVVFTLHRRAAGLVEPAMAIEGVRAARADGQRLEVIMEAPSRTIPRLFRLFADKRFGVEAIDLDDLPDAERVYRWSGNGVGGFDGGVLLDLHVDGDAAGLVAAVRALPNVRGVMADRQVLSVLMDTPQETVPELVRLATRRKMALLAIDPRPLDEDTLPETLDNN